MPNPVAAWLEKPRPVRVASTFRVAAAYETVVDLLQRPDALLLTPDVVDLVRLPSSTVAVLVLRRSGTTALDVVSVLPPAPDEVVHWFSHRTGTATVIAVEPAGHGSRVTVRLEHQPEPRAKARGWRDALELTLPPWRHGLTTVATGFQDFPVPQPGVVVKTQPSLPAATAHLTGERILAASPDEVWRALRFEGVDVDGTALLRTGGQVLAAGDVLWTVHHSERAGPARAHEVTAVEVGRLLVLRRLAHPFHPSLSTWRLEPAPGGTRVRYDHECATSHVGTHDDVSASLDCVERRLAR